MPTNHVMEHESTEVQEAPRTPPAPSLARVRAPARRGLAARFFGWLAPRRIHSPHSASRREIGDGDESRASSPRRGDEDIHGMAKRLIAQDRYGFVLLQAAVDQVHEAD